MPDICDLYPPLRFRDKVRAVLAISLAATVFMTLGWLILSPYDPYGTIALWASGDPIRTAAAVSLLALGVAAACALVAGTRLPDFGLFAIALGLAVVNLKGGAMDFLLVNLGGSRPEARGHLCFRLSGEVWIWMFLVCLTGTLAQWCVARIRSRAAPADEKAAFRGPAYAALEHIVSSLLAKKPLSAEFRQELRSGLSATGVSVVVAVIVISLAMTSSSTAAIHKGQVYFAVGAAFYLGALVGHQLFRPMWCLWPYLAVPLVATLGYILAMLRPGISGLPSALRSAKDWYDLLPMMPANDFARATPLDYISVGLAAAVAGCWLSRKTYRVRQEAEQ